MRRTNAVRTEGPAHASAVRRLASARDEEARLGDLFAPAAGTRTGPVAEYRLSEGRANVASREQWLHWIEKRESLAPWADGEWGPRLGARPRPARRPRPAVADSRRPSAGSQPVRQARQGVEARNSSRRRKTKRAREPQCLTTHNIERADRAGVAR